MIYKFIKSKTLSDYLDNNNLNLTDRQKIVIIANTIFSDSDKKKFLTSVCDESDDKELITTIHEYFEYDAKKLKDFKCLNENEIFVLSYTNEYHEPDIMISNDFDHLHNVGVKSSGDYDIKRYRYNDSKNIIGKYEYSIKDDSTDISYYNYDGYEFTCGDPYDIFDNTFFRLPHPFRNGDYVKNIYTGDIGICHGSSGITNNDYVKWCNEPLTDDEINDFGVDEMSLTCEMFCEENADFGHNHFYPWELEKIFTDDIPEELRNYFKFASYYIKQGVFLEDLFYYQCEYKRNKDKRR